MKEIIKKIVVEIIRAVCTAALAATTLTTTGCFSFPMYNA